MNRNEQIEANRRVWDERTDAHVKSKFYDVDSFRSGGVTLYPLEIEELGDVRGKKLLHLQCHFGLDTMSWARLGASVTGLDFSSHAIEAARKIAAELNLDATFVQSKVEDAAEILDGVFDVIYTGGGAIYWLPELDSWARVIAQFLAPGGTFYLREFHPFMFIFDDSEELTTPGKIKYPYFPQSEPIIEEVKGSYAARDADYKESHAYSWPHSFDEIITSLLNAGLRITMFKEQPFTKEKLLPWLERHEDGYHYAVGCDLPLMFSIQATKD